MSFLTPIINGGYSARFLVYNLLIGLALSLILSWYYTRFGQSMSNRRLFAPILPILTLVTILVISVVKTSLALSLGLVGALSIVRFRTAIKDPEELVFLFFSIAIGLGLGAEQHAATIAASVVILGYLLVRNLIVGRGKAAKSLYLNIEVTGAAATQKTFSELDQYLHESVKDLSLRRMDSSEELLQATYYLNLADRTDLTSLMDALRKQLPKNASISVVEQNNLLGG